MNIRYLFLVISIFTAEASANSTLDAAIGGGLGGAVGAAIGNEVSGRDGAIVGGAIGGAVGTAINTDKPADYQRSETKVRTRTMETHMIQTRSSNNNAYHCPPGQAKKGRC
ncbi:YMGG-like glycine zipper-containing protein [uncultured Amphritea sp.]|uniref:YMGG-like glycine zipper-containing protein n=1 Tax=uncultured Amphritea sp. TaxID=981605 RepID=UPI00263A08B9|nr:YMGG-like glycine zipper-containing protein [uncultured Amphritea sp.]